MKRHIYNDKSISYFYEVGDKIQLEKDGIFGFSTYKEGEVAIITELLEYKTFGLSKITTLISFVWIRTIKDPGNPESYSNYIKVPVWEIKPFDKNQFMESICLDDVRWGIK